MRNKTHNYIHLAHTNCLVQCCKPGADFLSPLVGVVFGGDCKSNDMRNVRMYASDIMLYRKCASDITFLYRTLKKLNCFL